jgi:biopolymer transport protein ExbD
MFAIDMDDRHAMRTMATLLVVAALGCSGKHDPNETPKPSQAALDRCTHAGEAVAKGFEIKAGSGGFAALDPSIVKDFACTDLYRQPSCAAAWQDAFIPAADAAMDERAKRIAATCAAAYCPHLSPAPALCIHSLEPAAPGGMDRLRDLDTAILASEGVDPVLAKVIANGRVGLLRSSEVKRTDAATPPADAPPRPPETLVLEVNAFGALVANDRPLARAELPAVLAGLAERKGRLVVEPSQATAQAKVIEILDQAKQAGITDFAIGVRKH